MEDEKSKEFTSLKKHVARLLWHIDLISEEEDISGASWIA